MCGHLISIKMSIRYCSGILIATMFKITPHNAAKAKTIVARHGRLITCTRSAKRIWTIVANGILFGWTIQGLIQPRLPRKETMGVQTMPGTPSKAYGDFQSRPTTKLILTMASGIVKLSQNFKFWGLRYQERVRATTFYDVLNPTLWILHGQIKSKKRAKFFHKM